MRIMIIEIHLYLYALSTSSVCIYNDVKDIFS